MHRERLQIHKGQAQCAGLRVHKGIRPRAQGIGRGDSGSVRSAGGWFQHGGGLLDRNHLKGLASAAGCLGRVLAWLAVVCVQVNSRMMVRVRA